MAATSKRIYLTMTDPTESQINDVIAEGYTPWTVTTQRSDIFKQGNLVSVRDHLIFHFLKRKEKTE